MKRIFCLIALSVSFTHARFSFSQWRGVEKHLPADKRSEEIHPVLGHLYLPLISNLRLVSGLYNIKKESRTQDTLTDVCPDFALLLKEMFPSGSGQFGWNNMDSAPFKGLTAKQIGRIIRLLSSQKDISHKEIQDILEEKEENIEQKEEKKENIKKEKPHDEMDRLVSNYFPPQRQETEDEKKKKEQKNIKKLEKQAQDLKKETEKKSQKLETELKDSLSTGSVKWEKNKTEQLAFLLQQAFIALKKQKDLPQDLLQKALLVFFFDRFDKEGDMQDFISGLGGKKDFKFQELEAQYDFDHKSFETYTRALMWGDEVLNPFAYPAGYTFPYNPHSIYKPIKEGQAIAYSNCEEASLMQVLDLLLYRDRHFQSEILNEHTPLYDFYAARGERGTRPEEAWNAVVCNLNLPKEHKYYHRENQGFKYDLNPGIIRVMHVLSAITGKECTVDYEEEIEEKPENLDNLKKACEKWLRNLFSELSNKTINVSIRSFKRGNSERGEDYFGVISIENPDQWSLDWHLSTGHSEIKNYKIDEEIASQQHEYPKEREAFLAKNSADILPILHKKPTDSFLKLFSSSLVNNPSAQINFVKMKIENPLWEATVRNILSAWNWDDNTTAQDMFFLIANTKLATDDILKEVKASTKIQWLKSESVASVINYHAIQAHHKDFIIKLLKDPFVSQDWKVQDIIKKWEDDCAELKQFRRYDYDKDINKEDIHYIGYYDFKNLEDFKKLDLKSFKNLKGFEVCISTNNLGDYKEFMESLPKNISYLSMQYYKEETPKQSFENPETILENIPENIKALSLRIKHTEHPQNFMDLIKKKKFTIKGTVEYRYGHILYQLERP